MGPRALALTLAAFAVASPVAARADGPACRAGEPPRQFATCFDPGNRLVLAAGTDGFGGALAVRHILWTADADVTWRFEHVALATMVGADRFTTTLYEGRYLRHSRDGHLVLPTNPPKKIFLPFDVGAEAHVGVFRGDPGSPIVDVGVVRAAALVELLRSDDFRRRITVGVVVRWDLVADGEARVLLEQRVAPFTLGALALHLESRDGLTAATVGLEAGGRWATAGGWGASLDAEASAERVLFAVNDRPFSIYASARWESAGEEATVAAGLRLAILGARSAPASARRYAEP